VEVVRFLEKFPFVKELGNTGYFVLVPDIDDFNDGLMSSWGSSGFEATSGIDEEERFCSVAILVAVPREKP
jgi:hypothetical protein